MAEVKRGFYPLALFKQGKLIIFGVLLAIICFAVGFFSGGRQEKAPVLSSITVENQLQQISQLATVRYSYTNMGQFENSNEFYGIKLPFTTKSFIVAYDGTIIAGVDLTQAKVSVTDQKVTISLPAPQILSHEVDPNSLEVFDETRSIFNPITIQDRHRRTHHPSAPGGAGPGDRRGRSRVTLSELEKMTRPAPSEKERRKGRVFLIFQPFLRLCVP